MDSDIRSCKGDDIPKVLTKTQGSFIMKSIKDRDCNYNELSIIQAAIKRKPEAFTDSNEAYDKITKMTMSKILKSLKWMA